MNRCPLLFLYEPGITLEPQKIDSNNSSYVTSGWQFAIWDEKVELKLGETIILAAHRQSSKNSMRTFSLLDEDTIKYMVEEVKSVLLLKIEISGS